eukprot:TRINITY_DN10551_c0_g3_i5.p1 TRINITY_DN10551_c0_g3~~TRINITY_DN10551_c0_g3_i5.p1  ORF type:complete len:112 (-),score=26.15 TRINITY_DN10551_c0_g3_i5:135-440(-)
MIRRPPRSTHCISSAASDVYKRQILGKSTNKREEAKFSTTSPVKEYSRRNPSLNIFLDRCAQGIPRVNKKLEWSPYSSVYKGKARVSPRLYVKIIGEHTIN